MDVVGEDPFAVDLDDRDQFAVARLQLGRAVDRDLLELELQFRFELPYLRQRPLAEMAAGAVVDENLRDTTPA